MIDYLDYDPSRTMRVPEPRAAAESIKLPCPNLNAELGSCMLSGSGCTIEGASTHGVCLERELLVGL